MGRLTRVPPPGAYEKARAEAQRKANETGFDFGIEANHLFGEYRVFMLPGRDVRCGHERRCEVVHPERLASCKPGHGPGPRGVPPNLGPQQGVMQCI